MEVNWGLIGNMPDAGNAFARGFQNGQELRKQYASQNALAAYAQNPDDANAARQLLAVNPEVGIKAVQDQRERQQQAQMMDVRRRAAGGDAGARQELFAIDPQTAQQLTQSIAAMDKRQRDAAKARLDAYAGIGTYLISLPYAQRRAAIAAQRANLESMGIDPADIEAFDPSDENLNAVMAQAIGAKDMFDLRNEDREFQARERDRAADNARADQGLAVRQGALALARQRSARAAAGGSSEDNSDLSYLLGN